MLHSWSQEFKLHLGKEHYLPYSQLLWRVHTADKHKAKISTMKDMEHPKDRGVLKTILGMVP